MCGIIGYIGSKEAFPILIDGLKKLEYRGYDSAGIALGGESLKTFKVKGKVADLERYLEQKDRAGTIGIGHTRWATHGEPNDKNAHPQNSMKGKFSVVHNGIIENYIALKDELSRAGYSFRSETDTEVLANLIEFFYIQNEDLSIETAVQLALAKVIGTYGIAVLSGDENDKIVLAKKESPLVVGLGENEYFVSSATLSMPDNLRQVIYLNDGDIAILKRDGFSLINIQGTSTSLKISTFSPESEIIEKNGFEHFMLKEIYEQPNVIEDILQTRFTENRSEFVLRGLSSVLSKLEEIDRVIIVGCGTSWHAALIGEYLLEEFARIRVDVEYASEFRYRKPVIYKKDVVILISQSGETADTLAALRLAKENEALVLGICNVPYSTLAREVDACVNMCAGVEIGVASTKAFTAQLTVLAMIAFKLASLKNTISKEEYKVLIKELLEIPAKIRIVLEGEKKIQQIAEKYTHARNALYLGRGYQFPIALEGALKLKEISYVHAEGYPAGEIKHGPIALVDDSLPVVVVAQQDAHYEKVLSNILEIKARKGSIIAIVNRGNTRLKGLVNDIIEVPESHPAVAPLLTIVPLQLFAYYFAFQKGYNIDQPRNLAKSVTVE